MGIKSNNISAAFHDFFSRSGDLLPIIPPPPPETGISATGGDLTYDYFENGNPYRSHTFLSSGDAFSISSIGTAPFGDKIDVLVVGGGGGGGHNIAGAGGAGGMRVFTDVPVSAGGPWPVTIGSGGAGS